MHLSIIIPAYNEEKRIREALLEIDKYLKAQNYDYEILVVNDGSKDKTSEITRHLMETIKNLRLIDNQKNQGKGAAVKQGILEAKGNLRLFMDADNAITIDQIENFWPWLKKGYDVIIGSIELPGSKIEEKAGWHRRFLGRWAKYLIRALTIWEIHDTQRAFKLFHDDAAEKIFKKQTIKRWSFDVEILVIAKKLGYKIKELPVTWINPSGSKVNLKGYLNSLKELFKIKWNLMKGVYDNEKN